MILTAGLLVSLAAAASPALDDARAAFDAGEYDRVLPTLDQALEQGLAPTDAAHAHALAAAVHAAFGRSDAAVERFQRALGFWSDYRPDQTESPKLKALFDEALRRGPVPAPSDAPTRVTTDGAAQGPAQVVSPALLHPETSTARTEASPIYARWWFWTAVGTAVAAGVAAAVVSQSSGAAIPSGNLGSERL